MQNFNPQLFPMLNACTDQFTTNEHIIEKNNNTTTLHQMLNTHNSILLLGQSGSGKTELVNSLVTHDTNHDYVFLNLNYLVALSIDNHIDANAKFKQLATEINTLNPNQTVIVLDEIQLISMMDSFNELVIQPLMQHHFKLLGITTTDEFNHFLRGFDTITKFDVWHKPALTNTQITDVLKDRKNQYLPDVNISDDLYDKVIDKASQYSKANAEPRRSIQLFDNMIGNYSTTNAFDETLLENVLNTMYMANTNQ